MHMVNIHEAKIHFSRLIDEVIRGHEVVIAIAGKPVARLSSVSQRKRRRFGILKGKIKISADFDAPLPADLLDAFKG